MKTKDEECQTLEQIRVDLESEVSELTASLFEEANKMVRLFKVTLSSLITKRVLLTLIWIRVSKGRDILLSLCPGTRAGAKILGQTPLSLDVPGQNY